ncbi:MAG: mechanosensitive ion channel family protein [ANME-2 cluster archaeon]|nr:mechanosensitive ion channel family protein [ANME-2 cluster archaeon]
MNVTDVFSSIPGGDGPVLKFLIVLLTIIGAVFVSKVATIYLRRTLKEKMSKDHLEIILKLTSYSIIIVAILFFMLPALNVEPSSILVAGSVVGFIIGFASQNIVGNMVSGLFLMTERPIKVGNIVNIDGNSGTVEDITLISTIIRTYDGLYVRIPNQTVFTTTITNYVANVARRFDYVVGIRYNDDADKAIEIIKNIIEDHPFTLKNPSPVVFVDNLGDNAVNIVVRIWAPSTDWYGAKTELLWIMKKTLEENGMEIAFPQRTLWFANELQSKQIDKKEVPSGNG